MAVKTVRKIIKIDETKCNGCGQCVPACVEGALKIIDGKARLVSETYCDGLGACLGHCPQDAIKIEEREAPEFDEKAVKQHQAEHHHHHKETLPCGCPGTAVREIEREDVSNAPKRGAISSRLGNFPVQLTLVPPTAPFLKNADILLSSDCVPFCYPDFHEGFLTNHALLIACPKLDDFDAHLGKLAEILQKSQPKSLTVVRMEVPCCYGLTHMAENAIKASGRQLTLKEIVIGIQGNIKQGV